MDSNLLRAFLETADAGSVSRAARQLGLSQPSLTVQIRRLEDQLGTRLFMRTPRGMRLLPAGEAFLHHARRILAEVEAAVHAVRGPGSSR